MQQLNVEQKIIEKQQSEQEQIKRECKGRSLAPQEKSTVL